MLNALPELSLLLALATALVFQRMTLRASPALLRLNAVALVFNAVVFLMILGHAALK